MIMGCHPPHNSKQFYFFNKVKYLTPKIFGAFLEIVFNPSKNKIRYSANQKRIALLQRQIFRFTTIDN